MRNCAFLLPTLLVASLLPAVAQTQPASGAVYKVEFRIREGGSPVGQSPRRYTMLIDATGRGSFRVGDRVPVATGSFQPGAGPAVNTQFSYLDVGVNIDTRVREQDGRIKLESTLDLSALVERKPQPGSAILPAPTVGQIKIVIDADVSPGKPTVVASIDDPVTQHRFDVEAIVTKE